MTAARERSEAGRNDGETRRSEKKAKAEKARQTGGDLVNVPPSRAKKENKTRLTATEPTRILPRDEMQVVRSGHLVEGGADLGVDVRDACDACARRKGASVSELGVVVRALPLVARELESEERRRESEGEEGERKET